MQSVCQWHVEMPMIEGGDNTKACWNRALASTVFSGAIIITHSNEGVRERGKSGQEKDNGWNDILKWCEVFGESFWICSGHWNVWRVYFVCLQGSFLFFFLLSLFFFVSILWNVTCTRTEGDKMLRNQFGNAFVAKMIYIHFNSNLLSL